MPWTGALAPLDGCMSFKSRDVKRYMVRTRGLTLGHTLTPPATSKDHTYIHPMDVYACTYSCLLLICQFAGAQSPTNSQSPTEEKHNGSSPFHSER